MEQEDAVQTISQEDLKIVGKTEKILYNIQIEKNDFDQIKLLLSEDTVESKKYQLLESLEESFDANLKKLYQLNQAVINPMLKQLIKEIHQLDLENIELDKLEIEESKKANNILKGLMLILPKQAQFDLEIKQFINTGKEGLKAIEEKLQDIQEIDSERVKKTGLILYELRAFEKTIKEQNKTIKKIRKKISSTFFRSILRKDTAYENDLIELKSLLSKEFEEHNAIIKAIYEIQIQEENNELNKILVFEQEEIQINRNLSLLLRQYTTPKLNFASSNYVLYQSAVSEAASIIQERAMSQNLPIYRETYLLGMQKFQLRFISFIINQQQNISEEILFVFPYEQAIRSNFFTLERGLLKIFFKPESFKPVKDDICKKIEKDIKETGSKWVEEAAGINKDFRESWTDDAKSMMEKNFTKRWMKERQAEFLSKLDVEFDIINYLAIMKLFASLLKGENATKNAFLEEVSNLDKEGLLHTVKEAKTFYKSALKDVDALMKTTSPDISQALILIPKIRLLYFEQLFDRLGYRPNVLYYTNDPRRRLQDFMAQQVSNQKPPAEGRLVKIFSLATGYPLKKH